MTDTPMTMRVAWLLTLASLALLVACEGSSSLASQSSELRAECVDDEDAASDSSWICPEDLTVECTGGDGTQDVDVIYVEAARNDRVATCGDVELSVSDPGPYSVGTHRIDVLASGAGGDGGDGGDGVVSACTAQLTIVDSEPPKVEGRTLELWPPNHQLQEITVADCVDAIDACDGEDIELTFTHARSDEPQDGLGDGHHEPDIVWSDCGTVQLRSERLGNADGRVYTLGVRARDHAGHVSETECHVVVPHDRGHGHADPASIDSDQGFEIMADEACTN